MPTPVRLVCFDLGGVAVRICTSWAEACRLCDVPLRRESFTPDQVASQLEIQHRYQCGEIDLQTLAELFSRATGDLYAPEEVRAVNDVWVRGEYNGIGWLIDSLHQAGYDTAALTNTCHDHWLELRAYSGVARLHHTVASHLVGALKPDAAIYAALETATGQRGDAILYFDDVPDYVRAAEKRGWRAVHIDPTQPTVPQIDRALAEYGVEV